MCLDEYIVLRIDNESRNWDELYLKLDKKCKKNVEGKGEWYDSVYFSTLLFS